MVVDPNGILVIIRRLLELEVIRVGSVKAAGLVRQRVLTQNHRAYRIERHLVLISADGHQPAPFRRRGHRNHGWLSQPLPEAGIFNEEKLSVLPDRSAQRPAKFVSLKWRNGRGKIIARVQDAITNELESAAMELIGAGLADNLRDGAPSLPKLCRVIRLLHLEFGDRIQV